MTHFGKGGKMKQLKPGDIIDNIAFNYGWKSIENYLAKPGSPEFVIEKNIRGLVVATDTIRHPFSFTPHNLWVIVKVLWDNGHLGWSLDVHFDPKSRARPRRFWKKPFG